MDAEPSGLAMRLTPSALSSRRRLAAYRGRQTEQPESRFIMQSQTSKPDYDRKLREVFVLILMKIAVG